MVDATHPNCRAVQAALTSAGSAGVVRILDEPAPSAAIAAEQLGVEVGAIANSLIFTTADGEAVLVMASGAHRVDTAKAATLLGVDRLDRAKPDQVLAATGQRIGGVSPVAHPAPLRTLVDRTLQDYEVIWAAGGVPHAVFPTTFDELVQITCGTAADIA